MFQYEKDAMLIQDQEDLINLLQNTDTKEIGDYNSVSNAINFIINSNYVTGSIIPIDGGFN